MLYLGAFGIGIFMSAFSIFWPLVLIQLPIVSPALVP